MAYIAVLNNIPSEAPPSETYEYGEAAYENFGWFSFYTQPSRSDILALVTGNTYYLDINADPGGDGSVGSPWDSLDDAIAGISDGDCVIVSTGEYGLYSETTTYTAWTLFIAAEGATPVLSGINIDRGSLGNCYLIFYGFEITPDYVDPASSGETGCDDPQYEHSVPLTYAKSLNPVNLYYAGYVRVYNCTIYGYDKNLTDRAVSIIYCDNIIIDHCEIHTVNRGIIWATSSNLSLFYNYVHGTASSFLVDGATGGSQYILIEGNHCHNMTWLYADDYCLREPDYYYHGSLCAINSPDCIIRNNLFHDGGNSAGVMFYSGATYSNILVENNLIYDPHNTTAFVMYTPGENIWIRNNVMVGRGRYGYDEQNVKYNGALSIYSSADGYDYSTIYLYNNVLIGIVSLDDGISLINHSNNIMFAIMQNWSFYNSTDVPNDILVIDDGNSGDWDYFETNFFNGTLDRSWYYWDVDEAVWTLLTANSPGHGSIIDMSMYSGSDGENYGKTTEQSKDTLGSLDGSNEFLLPGSLRSLSSHDVGAS